VKVLVGRERRGPDLLLLARVVPPASGTVPATTAQILFNPTEVGLRFSQRGVVGLRRLKGC